MFLGCFQKIPRKSPDDSLLLEDVFGPQLLVLPGALSEMFLSLVLSVEFK